ncbi:hypothetical protein BS47DRAFT_1367195 [Hydnum rufescens UP504]|uniref:FAD-binding PCMH-type domain-containing protein n=1 Tax=Hydnum rufescens UP504 TaxID=1448309 RepID=A0A9P6AJ38_9AGAM|nr:hypothetical protein BS47DRAFT_1367195 [Hydnum rufescens UP504]
MPFPSKTRSIGLVLGYLLVCPGVSAGHNHTTPAKTACRTLSTLLGTDKVQSAGGAQYEASATGAWDLYNQFDISAMRTVSFIPTRIMPYEVVVTVRCPAGIPRFRINNGVLIDFSQMKAFSYDPVRDSIFIEPGVLNGEVYDGLQSQGVAPVGGRVGAVGFSGLALGGGLSFLSPSQGWACDRFRSLDVVLTNGRLITATRTNEYSDLFTALKGGGSRFGIVTRYEVDAIHVGTAADKTYWGGTINYVGPTAAAVVKAIDALVYSNKDPNTVIRTTVAYLNVSGTFTTAAAVALFYNGTEAQFKQVFANFLAIPAAATNLGPLSYNEVTKVPSQSQAPGIGPRATNVVWIFLLLYIRFRALIDALYCHSRMCMGLYALPGSRFIRKSFNNWLNFSISFKNEVSTAALVITPVFQSQIDISRAMVVHPSLHKWSIWIFGYRIDPSLGVTKISKSLVLGSIDYITSGFPLQPASFHFMPIPRSPGLPLYLNESEDVQDALTTYSGYEKLKEISRKYDPTRWNALDALVRSLSAPPPQSMPFGGRLESPQGKKRYFTDWPGPQITGIKVTF